MDRKALKTNAKAKLRECKTNPYILTIVFLIVSAVLSGIASFFGSSNGVASLISIIFEVAESILIAGFTWWSLSVVRKNDDTGEFTLAYKKCVPVFLALLIAGIFIAIGTILFVIPGIIVELGLSMTIRCLRDDPDAGFWAAIKKSWAIMKGHKAELFVLQLSFIPWLLLTIITCGIVGIYTLPYFETTFSEYYETIKG